MIGGARREKTSQQQKIRAVASASRWEPANGIRRRARRLRRRPSRSLQFFDQEPEDELFPDCQEKKPAAVHARVPFGRRSLTARFTSKKAKGGFGAQRRLAQHFISFREKISKASVARAEPSSLSSPPE